MTLLTSNHTLLIVPSHASVSELSYLWAAPEQLHTAGNLTLSVGRMTEPTYQQRGWTTSSQQASGSATNCLRSIITPLSPLIHRAGTESRHSTSVVKRGISQFLQFLQSKTMIKLKWCFCFKESYCSHITQCPSSSLKANISWTAYLVTASGGTPPQANNQQPWQDLAKVDIIVYLKKKKKKKNRHRRTSQSSWNWVSSLLATT